MNANIQASNVVQFPGATASRTPSAVARVGNMVRSAVVVAGMTTGGASAVANVIYPTWTHPVTTTQGIPLDQESAPETLSDVILVKSPISAASFVLQYARDVNAWNRLVNIDTGTVVMNPDKALEIESSYLIAESVGEAHAVGAEIRAKLDNEDERLPRHRAGYAASEIGNVKITTEQSQGLVRIFHGTSYAHISPHDFVRLVTNAESQTGRTAMDHIQTARELSGKDRDREILKGVLSLLGKKNDVGIGQITPPFLQHMRKSHPELNGPLVTDNKILMTRMIEVFYRAMRGEWNQEMLLDALSRIDVRFDTRRIVPSIIDAHIETHNMLRKFRLPAKVALDLTLVSYNMGAGRAAQFAAKIAQFYRDGVNMTVDEVIVSEWFTMQDLRNRRAEMVRLHVDGRKYAQVAVPGKSPTNAISIHAVKHALTHPAWTASNLEVSKTDSSARDIAELKTAQILQFIPKESHRTQVESYLMQDKVQDAIGHIVARKDVSQDNVSRKVAALVNHNDSSDKVMNISMRWAMPDPEQLKKHYRKILRDKNYDLQILADVSQIEPANKTRHKEKIIAAVSIREEAIRHLKAVNDNAWLKENKGISLYEVPDAA